MCARAELTTRRLLKAELKERLTWLHSTPAAARGDGSVPGVLPEIGSAGPVSSITDGVSTPLQRRSCESLLFSVSFVRTFPEQTADMGVFP